MKCAVLQKHASLIPAVLFYFYVGIVFMLSWAGMFRSIAETEVDENTIEFRINGEAVTKGFIERGLNEASQCAPEVCPTDKSHGWKLRRDRLVRLIPLRQFLDRENIEKNDAAIENKINEMKKHPNPFGSHPPRRLEQVMVRECISWDDLKLMIRVEQGMTEWAEREWRKKWSDETKWNEYCAANKDRVETKYGKFRIYNFSILNWPAGAKTEEEAIEKLKQKALTVKRNLDSGLLTEKPDAVSIVPYNLWGETYAAKLRNLLPDDTAEILRTQYGWVVVKRESITPSELSDFLKQEVIQQMRHEVEERIAREAKLEKIAWTELGPDISAE